jgi:hypothetical protein
MLVSVHRQFMTSEMIAFAMGGCGGLVGVGGKIMELGNSIVGALGHDVLLVVRCGKVLQRSDEQCGTAFRLPTMQFFRCGYG